MTRTRAGLSKLRRFLLVKEVVMMTLIGLNLLLLAAEHLLPLTHAELLAIEIFDVATALLFLAEFGFEWYWARDQRQYVRHHWFYLLAAIPIPSTSFELLRGIRALRLLKLLKLFAHMRYERNTRLFESARFGRR